MTARRTRRLYRLIWVRDDGGFDAVTPLFAARDDEEASNIAVMMADGDRVELWRGACRVTQLGPSAHLATLQ